MLKTLHGFTRSVFPFIEVIFLSFLLGVAMGSSATAIVAFLFLIVTVYIWPILIRAVGWGIVFFLLTMNSFPNDTIFFPLIFGVLVGGIRFVMIKFMK